MAVGLEADGEEGEGEVGHGDGEPGDELVLQRRHVARQQRLDTTQVGSRAANETSHIFTILLGPCPSNIGMLACKDLSVINLADKHPNFRHGFLSQRSFLQSPMVSISL